MARPATRTLYLLIGAFVLLLILAFIVGGFLSVIFFLLALAIVVYFALVAVTEFRRPPSR